MQVWVQTVVLHSGIFLVSPLLTSVARNVTGLAHCNATKTCRGGISLAVDAVVKWLDELQEHSVINIFKNLPRPRAIGTLWFQAASL